MSKYCKREKPVCTWCFTTFQKNELVIIDPASTALRVMHISCHEEYINSCRKCGCMPCECDKLTETEPAMDKEEKSS